MNGIFVNNDNTLLYEDMIPSGIRKGIEALKSYAGVGTSNLVNTAVATKRKEYILQIMTNVDVITTIILTGTKSVNTVLADLIDEIFFKDMIKYSDKEKTKIKSSLKDAYYNSVQVNHRQINDEHKRIGNNALLVVRDYLKQLNVKVDEPSKVKIVEL